MTASPRSVLVWPMLLLAGWPPCALAAQASPDSLRAAADRLAPSTPVRLDLRSGRHASGRLVSVSEDGLRLRGRGGPVAFDTVSDLRARGRSVGTGLRIGAIAGGIGGAAGGALVGLVVGALCETESCASTGTDILVGAGLGLLSGAVGGGGLGAVIGGTVPRWVDARAAAPAAIGQLSATGAWSRHGSEADGSGVGGDLSYQVVLGPLALGPEFGWHGLGSRTTVTHVPCSSAGGRGVPADTAGLCDVSVSLAGHVWHAGGVLRVSPVHGRLQPYGVGGLGYYSWSGVNLAGYSIGAGARWSPRPIGPALHLEMRWHSNLSRDHVAGPLGYVTVGLGGDLRW